MVMLLRHGWAVLAMVAILTACDGGDETPVPSVTSPPGVLYTAPPSGVQADPQ
ncbi:MAG TPA: hypothetical protein VHK63_04865 [Candidatus Limnocylindria bacterium]|nr:hypothetical protein [Candidatus Limnocylindria bacterium]